MGMFNFLGQLHAVRRVEELSQEVADHCHQAVWERVQERGCRMGLFEARGYVRSRALEIVQSEVRRVISARPEFPFWAKAELVGRSLDCLTLDIVTRLVDSDWKQLDQRRAA